MDTEKLTTCANWRFHGYPDENGAQQPACPVGHHWNGAEPGEGMFDEYRSCAWNKDNSSALEDVGRSQCEVVCCDLDDDIPLVLPCPVEIARRDRLGEDGCDKNGVRGPNINRFRCATADYVGGGHGGDGESPVGGWCMDTDFRHACCANRKDAEGGLAPHHESKVVQ